MPSPAGGTGREMMAEFEMALGVERGDAWVTWKVGPPLD